MAKASFRWKHFLYLVFKLSFTKKSSRRGKGFFCLFAMAIMFFWNWKLLLATVAGMVVMRAVYLMPRWNWQTTWKNWERFLTGFNRQFSLAVCSGGVASLSVYLITCIYGNVESPWLATGLILQGLLSLFSFFLLVWQFFTLQVHRYGAKFERWLSDLTDLDPLKRLIAVRQLTNLVEQKYLTAIEVCQVTEYFRLMLSIEVEPLIREAILESLKTSLSVPVNIPLQMPIKFKTSSFSIYQR